MLKTKRGRGLNIKRDEIEVVINSSTEMKVSYVCFKMWQIFS